MDSNFNNWLNNKESIIESSARYSVEVNYRSSMDEVIDSFAKLTLGYVSAGLKNCGFHVKNLYHEKPFRIFVSTRNWDDGEWVGVVVFDTKQKCFVIAKGYYNKDRQSVTIMGSQKCTHKVASEICREMRNFMEKLKKEKPRGSNTLNPVPLKRGPKQTIFKKLKKP